MHTLKERAGAEMLFRISTKTRGKQAVAFVGICLLNLAWESRNGVIKAAHALSERSTEKSAIQSTGETGKEISAKDIQALADKAISLRGEGRFQEAIQVLEEILLIFEDSFGQDHPDTVGTTGYLAEIYHLQGLYGQATTLYQRALAISQKALGLDHPATATILYNMARLYDSQGLYSQGEPLYQSALMIREKVLGAEHPDVAQVLNDLGELFRKQGLYAEAEPLYKRALLIKEKALGPNHPDVAASLNNMALLYDHKGFHAQAEPLYNRALLIWEKTLGPDHPSTATTLNNIGLLYYNRGIYDKAEKLYNRALSIREKALGLDDPDVAQSLNNLAELFSIEGHHSQAESLHKRALSIREKALGPDHPDVAFTLSNLAVLYDRQGLYDQAQSLQKRALAIREKALGPDHPDVATSLNNLASSYTGQGLYSQAKTLHQRALAIREQGLGVNHPYFVQSLNNLAVQDLSQGNYDSASELLARGISSKAEWLIREGRFLPRSQRLELIGTLGSTWEAVYYLSGSTLNGPRLALSTRLLLHGLLLEIEHSQATLSRSPGTKRELADRVAALNNRISDIHLTQELRRALREQRNELEQQLFRQWPDLRIPRITPEQAAAALPSDGALVEFQRYRTWEGAPERYLALILKPNGAISAVPLGDVKMIDESISLALSASAQAQLDADERWAKVSNFVLQPLAPYLAGSRQWFFSPDGELHRVPFAALPSPSRPGVPLASAVQLRLLTTGRDMVRFQKPVPSGSPSVVLANPNFDRGRRAPAALIASSQSQQRSGELSNQRWDSLPATAREGEQVATMLGAKPISGDAATVGVLQRSIGPRVLHIASHGFFVGDQDIAPEDPLMASLAGGGQLARFQGEDPLLRSGIVLAGANNPDLDPNDDGLLTALEATALQLDGTELVVLSACSTGSGDIQSGEGLYGLQRALTVAGARSTLLSLWKVDDAATAEFMVRFYRRLKAGEGRADALAAAQAEFRAGDVKGPAGEDWTRPYYWAAWQLVGDWRPIEGL